MKKIISLTSKDWLTGINQDYGYPLSGIFKSSTSGGINPFTSGNLGHLALTKKPVEVGSLATPTGYNPTMVLDGDTMYIATGTSMFKVTTCFGTPSLSKIRDANLSNGTGAVEILQTKTGSKYLYYWQTNQIGIYDLSGTYPTGWTDNKFAISTAYQGSYHPILRIDDTIFYGANYAVSSLKDDGSTADAIHTEEVLDLPKEYTITALGTDGNYLFIGASKNSGSSGKYNETKIYIWDYKNNLVSWTTSYSVPEETIMGFQYVDGIMYFVGRRGLYYMNAVTAPKRIRTDIVNVIYNQGISQFNQSVTLATSYGLYTYGKIVPNTNNATFNLSNLGICLLKTDASQTRTFVVDDTNYKLHYLNILSAETSSSETVTVYTAQIPLDNIYKISRIDFIFKDKLQSGNYISTPQINVGGGGIGQTIVFDGVSYTLNGATGSATTYPTTNYADYSGDSLIMNWTQNGGTLLNRIDIYGEQINRN